MRKLAWIAAFIIILFTCAYAIESNNVEQGADKYDWQSCIDSKAGDCKNNCATSEDTDCKDKCDNLARDKCLSEGLTEPNGSR